MKKFKLPVYWEMSGSLIIEAESQEEAVKYAYSSQCRLPDDGYYLDDSFEVEEDGIEELEDEV